MNDQKYEFTRTIKFILKDGNIKKLRLNLNSLNNIEKEKLISNFLSNYQDVILIFEQTFFYQNKYKQSYVKPYI
jgi:hypothetical protein